MFCCQRGVAGVAFVFCSVINRELCSLHDEAVVHKIHTQKHICGGAAVQGVREMPDKLVVLLAQPDV